MSSDDLKSDALVSRRASVGLARQSSKASIFSAKDDEPRGSRQRRQSSVSSNRSHGKSARETYDTDETDLSSGAGSDAESVHSEGEAERAAREAREAVERAAAERISRTTKGYLHRTRVMPRLRAGYDENDDANYEVTKSTSESCMAIAEEILD